VKSSDWCKESLFIHLLPIYVFPTKVQWFYKTTSQKQCVALNIASHILVHIQMAYISDIF